jgi:hypothetical protein
MKYITLNVESKRVSSSKSPRMNVNKEYSTGTPELRVQRNAKKCKKIQKVQNLNKKAMGEGSLSFSMMQNTCSKYFYTTRRL